jgi:hypothetical protein
MRNNTNNTADSQSQDKVKVLLKKKEQPKIDGGANKNKHQQQSKMDDDEDDDDEHIEAEEEDEGEAAEDEDDIDVDVEEAEADADADATAEAAAAADSSDDEQSKPKKPKTPTKLPLAFEKTQALFYHLISDTFQCDDEQIALVLGIKDNVQDQIQRRKDFNNNKQKFDDFKAWKKRMIKPKVVKVATKTAKKAASGRKPKMDKFDSVRIPDNQDGIMYRVARTTLPGDNGPEVFLDNFDRTMIGHLVDGSVVEYCPR